MGPRCIVELGTIYCIRAIFSDFACSHVLDAAIDWVIFVSRTDRDHTGSSGTSKGGRSGRTVEIIMFSLIGSDAGRRIVSCRLSGAFAADIGGIAYCGIDMTA